MPVKRAEDHRWQAPAREGRGWGKGGPLFGRRHAMIEKLHALRESVGINRRPVCWGGRNRRWRIRGPEKQMRVRREAAAPENGFAVEKEPSPGRGDLRRRRLVHYAKDQAGLRLGGGRFYDAVEGEGAVGKEKRTSLAKQLSRGAGGHGLVHIKDWKKKERSCF